MAEESAQYPIIDSHIHLYPSSELSTLAWCTPTNPLNSQHSLDEYAAATGSPRSLEGFIFLETDRKHDLESGEKDGSGWESREVRELSNLEGHCLTLHAEEQRP